MLEVKLLSGTNSAAPTAALNRLVSTDNGTYQKECVLTQILNRFEQELGSTRSDHWFIGLSATPFELNDLSRLWEVRQALTDAYSGFNYFNGRPISPGSNIQPPVGHVLFDD